MNVRNAMLLALALGAAPAIRAQQPSALGPAPTRTPPPDPLMSALFPPDLIMQNQTAIGLTPDQSKYIIQEIERVQTLSTGIQWSLQGAMERLSVAVHEDHPDEPQVLALLDSVLTHERDMKRAQIGLLVRIKDHLTPDQQAALRQKMQPSSR